MNVKALIIYVLFATQSAAQGFSGLGSDAAGYFAPDPEKEFEFPADHGPHPGFRIEWWYMTANLTGTDGNAYGVQWTLFRSALSPDDSPPPIWMGHAAVTTPTQHFASERFAKGGTGQAGAQAEPFQAWIDDWHMDGIQTGTLNARGPDFAYSLKFATDKPFVAQGKNGYSVKAATGQASHYYSQPFYQINGTLDLPDGLVRVTGEAWLDREWSTQPLANTQTGWDWISLHLENGAKLMGFRLRSDTGAPYTTGTWIAPDGTPSPLPPGAFIATPLDITPQENRNIPTRWRIEVPTHDLDIELSALNPNAWMPLTVSYWEGPVRFEGTHRGEGYLEMTGYD